MTRTSALSTRMATASSPARSMLRRRNMPAISRRLAAEAAPAAARLHPEAHRAAQLRPAAAALRAALLKARAPSNHYPLVTKAPLSRGFLCRPNQLRGDRIVLSRPCDAALKHLFERVRGYRPGVQCNATRF